MDSSVRDRVGVCSWSFALPLDRVAEEMRKMDVRRVNLALQPFIDGDRHGAAESPEAQQRALARVRSGEWLVTATMISFPHEDYSSPAAIYRTGGVMPDEHWPSVEETVRKAAALTGELRVPYMLMHAGHLDWSDPAGSEKFVMRVTALRDICRSCGVGLIFETGQETADDLVRLMPLVEGAGINFDPANMIDGAKGDPVEAVRKLFPWIRHIHIKDAVHPTAAGVWGREVPWGTGNVDAGRFLATLMELGYTGDFAVERESGDDRVGDIAAAVRSVRDKMKPTSTRSPDRFPSSDPRGM